MVGKEQVQPDIIMLLLYPFNGCCCQPIELPTATDIKSSDPVRMASYDRFLDLGHHIIWAIRMTEHKTRSHTIPSHYVLLAHLYY